MWAHLIRLHHLSLSACTAHVLRLEGTYVCCHVTSRECTEVVVGHTYNANIMLGAAPVATSHVPGSWNIWFPACQRVLGCAAGFESILKQVLYWVGLTIWTLISFNSIWCGGKYARECETRCAVCFDYTLCVPQMQCIIKYVASVCVDYIQCSCCTYCRSTESVEWFSKASNIPAWHTSCGSESPKCLQLTYPPSCAARRWLNDPLILRHVIECVMAMQLGFLAARILGKIFGIGYFFRNQLPQLRRYVCGVSIWGVNSTHLIRSLLMVMSGGPYFLIPDLMPAIFVSKGVESKRGQR